MSAVTGLVTLSTPITRKLRAAGGEETEESVNELVLRRPIAKDLLATDGHNGEAGKLIALIAHLATVPIATIDGLRRADFETVVATLEKLKSADWAEGSAPSLQLREMLAGDLRVTDQHQGEAAKSMALIARLAGVEVATVYALPIGEFEALTESLDAGPTPPGLPTGQTASAS